MSRWGGDTGCVAGELGRCSHIGVLAPGRLGVERVWASLSSACEATRSKLGREEEAKEFERERDKLGADIGAGCTENVCIVGLMMGTA